MKRKLFGIVRALVFLLTLGLVLAGCDNGTNGNDDENGSSISLTFPTNEQVYTINSATFATTPYNGSGTVKLCFNDKSAIDVGTVTNGKLTFNLPDLQEAYLTPSDYPQVISISPTGMKGYSADLRFYYADPTGDDSTTLGLGKVTGNSKTFVSYGVGYFYASYSGATTASITGSISTSSTTETWQLHNLRNGWNRVIVKMDITEASEGTYSVYNNTNVPSDLKWTLGNDFM